MDFDPSAFLSMAMTEEQDTFYTVPNVPQEVSPDKIPPGKITVEGGLQMEQDMQIPIPMFGLLGSEEGEQEDREGCDRPEVPMQIDITEPGGGSATQASPAERTSSPTVKKIIQTTFEETRFRKDLFNGHYERVKIFRLHCTICDRHMGCAPWFTERWMRNHKLLNVVVCRKCFEFYGDINFPIEDGSEIFCCWCGQGGDCFCCSTCPKIVCKKCITRNFGDDKVKEIDENDDWSCFVCKPEDIWPHRALMWGLQRWNKGMRQLVAMLSKEERQSRLSKDTSHCCLKEDEEVSYVNLPFKLPLTRVPLKMIAVRYQALVKDVLTQGDTLSRSDNGNVSENNDRNYELPNNFSTKVMERATNDDGGFPKLQNMLRATAPMTMIPQHYNQVSNNMVTPQQNQLTRTMVPQHQNHLSQTLLVSQQNQSSRTIVVPQQHNQLSRTMAPQHQNQQQMPRNMVGFHVKQVVQKNIVPINRPTPYPTNRNIHRAFESLTHLQPFQNDPRIVSPSYRQMPPLVYTSTPRIPERISLEKDSPAHPTKPPLLDISPLESGVRDVKKILKPTLLMLDEFDFIKNDLANDIEKLTNFSERLSYNIKIAICNLAKSNTDLIESQKKIIDNRVSDVVNNIQLAVGNCTTSTMNGTLTLVDKNGNESCKKESSPHTIVNSSPEIIEVSPNPSKKLETSSSKDQETPATTGEEVEDVAIAMLCETVLEVGENKENKDVANKNQVTPIMRPQQVISKPVKGNPKARRGRKRLIDQNESSEIQVIDLLDEEEEKKEKFDSSFWLNKFKIVPCKVVLERLEKS